VVRGAPRRWSDGRLGTRPLSLDRFRGAAQSELELAPPLEAVGTDDVLAMYRTMLRIRYFEEKAQELYRDGEIPGFVHLSIGQEPTAVGACWPLAPSDRVVSNHRGHGHCLAKGLDMAGMFAELLGRETGTCRGRGGSMHIADPALGILGANGIVGAGLPIATGAALASRLRDDHSVTVAFFGDGAVNTGSFHESVNLAALWHLPIIFFCENNHFAEFSSANDQHPVPIVARADAYGIEAVAVAGNDVEAVATAMRQLARRCRVGGGPFLVEADTYRWRGHYEGDPERYRTRDDVAAHVDQDPIDATASRLLERGVASQVLSQIQADVRDEIASSLAVARAGAEPSPETLFEYVEDSATRTSAEPAEPSGEPFRVMDAIHDALAIELESDPEVLVLGIDVGAGGNVFGITRGLHQRWPDRVRDTPISETAAIGAAVGAALVGMRPVVELMYLDFLGVCLDQIMNQAAKLRYMTGGAASVPLTIRSQIGAGRSSGSQHSQSLEAMLAHIPGLTVVMPSSPADTYGLLRAAIRDPNPVVFIENRLLYGIKGPRPPVDHLVPLGKAKVVREGADLTVVSWSRMLHETVFAAEILAGENVSAEVIDLRTIRPLDIETVLQSLSKTGRLLIAHEAVRDFGVGAEIAAQAADAGFWKLDAPIARVGAAFTPAPYAPALERVWLPGREAIAEAMRQLARV